MRRIVVINKYPRTSAIIKAQLDTLLEGLVRVDCASPQEGLDHTEADLILLSTPTMTEFVNRHRRVTPQVVVMKRTLTREAWESVMAIPPQTRVLLVSTQQESTFDTVTMLYELGVAHLEIVPFYPGLQLREVPEIAITPNEMDLVPAGVKEVINLGERVLDWHSIVDILIKLDLLHHTVARRVFQACLETTQPTNPRMLRSIHGMVEKQHHLELILGVVDEGIIAFDEEGRIIIFNEFASRMFGNGPARVEGQLLRDFFQRPLESLSLAESIQDQSYMIRGVKYLVNKYSLYSPGHYLGGVIRFTEHSEIKRLEHQISREAGSQGHKAKYTFEHIIGASNSLRDTCDRARRMARGSGTVLVEGESGVGKELFAQAIHNASNRRGKPFVAFNCASLPDSLLESELFGYEDGAFTGARKGGKPGMFELAHHGTIFLDEIGDISASLQAKLLRVLQEKEILRVGGRSAKPVDIRVIAATNKNLKALVAEGRFREDLYYRINALLLRIPPLRERAGDILPLLRHFLHRHGGSKPLCDETEVVLKAYPWPGNVRELENCAVHLASMSDKPCLTIGDLPLHIAESAHAGDVNQALTELGDFPETLAILRAIHEARLQGGSIGRGRLCKVLSAQGIHLSDQEVRGRLRRLVDTGFVYPGRGRAGSRLTPEGERYLSS